MSTLWYFLPFLLAILLVSIAAGATKRLWVQCLVGALLLVGIAIYSIWILILAWGLAALGILMVLSGVIWRLMVKPTSAQQGSAQSGHPSGGLIYPGLGLLGAPFANIFIVMPIARANPDLVRYLTW